MVRCAICASWRTRRTSRAFWSAVVLAIARSMLPIARPVRLSRLWAAIAATCWRFTIGAVRCSWADRRIKQWDFGTWEREAASTWSHLRRYLVAGLVDFSVDTFLPIFWRLPHRRSQDDEIRNQHDPLSRGLTVEWISLIIKYLNRDVRFILHTYISSSVASRLHLESQKLCSDHLKTQVDSDREKIPVIAWDPASPIFRFWFRFKFHVR